MLRAWLSQAWNDVAQLQAWNYWLKWISVIVVLIGSGLFAAAQLIIERRVNVLAAAREVERATKERELARQLADSRARVADLEQRNEPRQIAPDAEARMIEVLKGAPVKHVVLGHVNSMEAVALHRQIQSIFEAAGWKVVRNHFYMDIFAKGIILGVHNDDQVQHPAVAAIWTAFKAGGIDFTAEVQPTVALEDQIPVVLIGVK